MLVVIKYKVHTTRRIDDKNNSPFFSLSFYSLMVERDLFCVLSKRKKKKIRQEVDHKNKVFKIF